MAPTQHNVQLPMSEAIRVYTEIATGRILGFCPANAKLLGGVTVRYRDELLYHARDIEIWVARYRKQQEDDAEQATHRQIQREAGFRKRLDDAIVERNKHVNPFNRDLNNVLRRLMSERYDAMMAAKAKPVIEGMAERQEASPHAVEEFAMEAYKKPVDTRASGAAVDPGGTVRAIYEEARQGQ